MSLHHIFEDFPDDGLATIDDFLRALYSLHYAALDELTDNERLVKLCSHEFRKSALMHVEFRTDDDDRTCGVVDPLSKEVLAEASLLSLEGIGERLESPVGLALDRAGLLGVVEK